MLLKDEWLTLNGGLDLYLDGYKGTQSNSHKQDKWSTFMSWKPKES